MKKMNCGHSIAFKDDDGGCLICKGEAYWCGYHNRYERFPCAND